MTIRKRDGATQGVAISETRDIPRLRLLARWYALSARQIARFEAGWGTEMDEKQLASATNVVRKRLRFLEQIAATDLVGGPLTGQLQTPKGVQAWYATPHAMDLVDNIWNLKRAATVAYTTHAMAAFDVAMSLEPYVKGMGGRIVSERESATNTDEFGHRFPVSLASKWDAIEKRPDVVLLAGNGQKYVNVEVERRQRAPIRDYEDKMRAYSTNPSVIATWYVVEGADVERKVRRAVAETHALYPGAPIRVVQMGEVSGFKTVDLDPEMRKDLMELSKHRQPQEVSA